MHSPRTENGGSLIRSPTPGPPFLFTGHVRDRQGQPVIGAEADVWHSSTAGLYDVQDSTQADMNLRGQFITDETGTFRFRSIKPVGYPIPADQNVVGQLLRAQGRHCLRPAHVHVLIFKPGLKTLISQVFMPDDPHIDDDVQFGVTQNLIGNLARHDGPAPGHPEFESPWYSLEHTFIMDPGEARLPTPPIK
jgi:catechol 1,2-dioxygenase